jgi:hypothetical protein
VRSSPRGSNFPRRVICARKSSVAEGCGWNG